MEKQNVQIPGNFKTTSESELNEKRNFRKLHYNQSDGSAIKAKYMTPYKGRSTIMFFPVSLNVV